MEIVNQSNGLASGNDPYFQYVVCQETLAVSNIHSFYGTEAMKALSFVLVENLWYLLKLKLINVATVTRTMPMLFFSIQNFVEINA